MQQSPFSVVPSVGPHWRQSVPDLLPQKHQSDLNLRRKSCVMLRVMRLSHSAKRFWALDREDKNDRPLQVIIQAITGRWATPEP